MIFKQSVLKEEKIKFFIVIIGVIAIYIAILVIGLITEDAHTVTYASATSSEMYDFFIDTKTCVPRTQDIFYGNPVTNINDIDDFLIFCIKKD